MKIPPPVVISPPVIFWGFEVPGAILPLADFLEFVILPCGEEALLLPPVVDAVDKETPWVELLLQVHDSIVFQFPISHRTRINEIHSALHSVIIPYDDPLCIPWKLSLSLESWGAATAVEWKSG